MSHFYEDLVRIRKSKRLSKQDVFYKCRVPLETIESIEDGSILSGSMRNKTYMRSYFRTYARALGISFEDITTALDEHDAGLYNQGLLMKYLPGEVQDDSGDQSGEEKAGKGGKTKEKADGKEKAGEKKEGGKGVPSDESLPRPQKSKTITPESQEKTASDIEWEDENINKVRSTTTTNYSASESRSGKSAPVKLPDPPDVEGIDWASKVKEAVYRPQRNRLLWVILAIILALALALASIVWFWQDRGTDPEAPPAAEHRAPSEAVQPSETGTDLQPTTRPGGETPDAADPVQPDVTAADEPEIVQETTPPAAPTRQEIVAQLASFATTGDTLYIYAYAIHGTLEPVRVLSDIFAGEDLQDASPRPYWVEQRQAMRFDFLDNIIFQGSLARMVLLFNGHIIEDFTPYYTDGSRIHVTRDQLMENNTFDIAAGDPFTDLEPPRSIVDRPRFSP